MSHMNGAGQVNNMNRMNHIHINIPNQGKVLAAYDPEIQSLVHCEELSELSKAVTKMRRKRYMQPDEDKRDDDAEYYAIVEEAADVLVVIEQLKEMYGISDSEIQEVVDKKCRRQEARLNELA